MSAFGTKRTLTNFQPALPIEAKLPLFFWGTGANCQHLALVLYIIDHGELLFVQFAVLAHHHLGKILVHDDVAGFRIDHDRALWAIEFPSKQRFDRGVAVHLAFGSL